MRLFVNRFAAFQFFPAFARGNGKWPRGHSRNYGSSDTCVQVSVLGASGGIGQPLSLLLKLSPLVSKLHLIDLDHTLGVAADLSHIDTTTTVKGYITEKDQKALDEGLKGSDIVIIPAGVPRKPGMSRDDLFNVNASIVRDLVAACACACPKAFIGIISNPINSTVPIAAEVMKLHDVYDPKRIFGITSLDLVRANTFIAEAKNLDLADVEVPVIGGHAGKTIIPVLSQVKPTGLCFSDDEVDKLTHKIQEAGTEVVKAKAGTGSATLSMAYAGARFTFSLCKALKGESVYDWAYVSSCIVDGVSFFSSKLLLGKDGVAQNLGNGELNKYEQDMVANAVKLLQKSIAKGVEFVKKGN